MLKNWLHGIHFAYLCLWFVVLIVLSFFITLVLLLFPAFIRDRGMFFLMKLISHLWFLLGGIRQQNFHGNKIDFRRSYIITPNHQSYLDAAIIYTSIPGLFKTLGKVEIERAPVYGLIYKTVVITVDRSSATARANSFRRMKREIEQGLSVTIFSEGTFPEQPQEHLLPFQQGGYALAILQQVDIVPVLYLDAARRMHPSRIWKTSPGLNRSVFLPVLSTAGLERGDAAALTEYARQYMQACLDFCRMQHPSKVWDFALLWRRENPFPHEVR